MTSITFSNHALERLALRFPNVSPAQLFYQAVKFYPGSSEGRKVRVLPNGLGLVCNAAQTVVITVLTAKQTGNDLRRLGRS